MKNVTLQSNFYSKLLLFLCFAFILTACGIFPRSVKKFNKGKIDEAEEGFVKSTPHATYGPGARYYLERIKVIKSLNTKIWINAHQTYCELEVEVNQLPRKQIVKLSKYDAGRADIMKTRERLQTRIFGKMITAGTIEELLLLEDNAACWSDRALDSLRLMIVNKTLNPENPVFEAGEKWKSQPISLPSKKQVIEEAGRSCKALNGFGPLPISYQDAATITTLYADKVLPSNFSTLWEIQEEIWDIFEIHEPYCKMDQFKEDFPSDLNAHDCSYEAARDTLCLGEIKPLLQFHLNNPYTFLDHSICEQIICLSTIAPDALFLNAQEQKHLDDVWMMYYLNRQLYYCEPKYDTTELIGKIEYLAQTYENHRAVFDLAIGAIDFFATASQFSFAKKALSTFRPLFTDAQVCDYNYYHQVGKQAYFDTFEKMLKEAEENPIYPKQMTDWNTPEQDEYGLVSWGDTDEVFFVRRDPITGFAQVMTSRLKEDQWSKPTTVVSLSIADDVVPLSISGNGQMMVLKSAGKLWRSYRPATHRSWLKPEPIPLKKRFVGNAWISPNDSLLLFENYAINKEEPQYYQKDIMVAVLEEGDRYGEATSVGPQINYGGTNEHQPVMAVGGRLLFYTSNRRDGLGYEDMYSAVLNKPYDWSSLEEPKNLGIPLSTIHEDEGITYFSEYTGMAYYHRLNRCNGSLDVWGAQLRDGVFPENAIRLAGIVLDENNQRIGGGFMEFIPDYQLEVHAEFISRKGTYTYTVEDSTSVVRLFPEIPGYYSEHDTTHFLGNVQKGEIIRDTFRLTSFDYIRKNFKLTHSTFEYGESEFNNPPKAYPELTRLSKIATRMGAELELRGHTDGVGAEAENIQLSVDRANAVKQFLVEKCGFEPDRIKVEGFGSSRPICSNETEEGRRCNRRIEIIFKMPDLPTKKRKVKQLLKPR